MSDMSWIHSVELPAEHSFLVPAEVPVQHTAEWPAAPPVQVTFLAPASPPKRAREDPVPPVRADPAREPANKSARFSMGDLKGRVSLVETQLSEADAALARLVAEHSSVASQYFEHRSRLHVELRDALAECVHLMASAGMRADHDSLLDRIACMQADARQLAHYMAMLADC